VETSETPSRAAPSLAASLLARLEAIEKARTEAIAVVGVGCSFPGGGRDMESFWRTLMDGADTITEVPLGRWDLSDIYAPEPASGKLYARHGGFLENIERFDAEFFDISAREALSLDPQQRLTLEVAWRALEDAGVPPGGLAGSATGVFIGATSSDYGRLLLRDGDLSRLDGYYTTGNALNAIAGRLSYFLGLRGPSLAVDTACSSSLAAVHLAAQSLRLGECDLALAGGVNVLAAPDVTISICQARMLSADGRCKTFDASADGYGRGEGCGVVVLKRLSDARASGDRILALVRGSAMNQDGRSAGFTVPLGSAQTELIGQALKCAGVAPATVDYLEAHGTGTPLGDPIEVNAAAAVYGEGRERDRPLLLGSVKANLGHLESAAGIAGFIKAVLALHHETIPPHPCFRQPNPRVDWAALPVAVPTRATPWPRGPSPRRAGVSAFGISGTNVHVVLEEAPVAAPVAASLPERPLQVLALSARDDLALRQLAADYAAELAADPPLCDVTFTAAEGRTHFRRRLAVMAATSAEARAELDAWVARAESAPDTGARPRLAFLFTGQGAQYAGMGRHLHAAEPVFREALERCDTVARPLLGHSLAEALFSEFGGYLLGRTLYAQPALFALEYALACLWRSWGIEPDWVMGHSVGEYAAACVAGVFSVEEGMRLIVERARLMQSLPGDGMMAAVFAGADEVIPCLAGLAGVEIAALNGPRNVVLSGRRAALEMALARCRAAGMDGRPLDVSHAFHSSLLEPILGEFAAAAAACPCRPPGIKLVSNLTGQAIGAEITRPDYWVSHARQTVRFQAGMEALAEAGCRVFVEIGPKPTLIGLGRRCLPDGVWLPSLTEEGGWRPLLESLGSLYGLGFNVDWASFHRDRPGRKTTLPGYPFQGQRYWPESRPGRRPPDQPEGFYAWRWRDRPASVPGDDPPAPATLATAVEPLAARRTGAADFLAYWAVVERIESLAVDYAARALRELGWDPAPGSRFTAAALAARLCVVAPRRRLFARLLEMLAEDGRLERRDDGFEVPARPRSEAPSTPIAEWLARHPEAALELTLLDRCGSGLGAVLSGRRDPLGLLFPEGDKSTAAGLYQDAPGARVMNELVRETVAAALRNWPRGRPLRVLEIGAGTGGTTSWILPILPSADTDYVYTDVSPAFFAPAREKFAAYPYLRYRALDIERDPDTQGFAGERFDLCIAASALHATRDIGEALGHARRLLAPSGLLILLEGTAPLRFIDLIFGQTDGWWRFLDYARRPAHPLPDVAGWLSALRDNGFQDPQALSGTGPGLLAKQAVIAARAPARRWLILADRGSIGERLAARLRAAGDACVLAGPERDWTPEALDDLLRRVPDAHEVLALWGLDVAPASRLSVETLDDSVARACRTTLWLVQSLARIGADSRLWLVTRGAAAAASDDAVPGIAAAVLWGMGRSLRSEHPELRCALIDLDPVPGAADVETLCRELRGEADDDQVALRAGRRYAPRLTRFEKRSAAVPAFAARPDAAYLVTGGLRGLGPPVARWLADHGARHLVLLGRRGADAAGQSCVDALRARGVQVLTLRADVADRGRMKEVMAEIETTLPPLRGVIHAAGVLDDGVLVQQDWERYDHALAPKVRGSWHLHEMTLERDLDFFVLFSSIAGLVGPPGQANHASACAFQDALAHYRRALGLPALSIDWGAWSEVGAAANQRVAERVRRKGVGVIEPEWGLAALGEALVSGETQLAVWPVDWPTWRTQYPGRLPRWLEEVLADDQSEAVAPARTVRGDLESADSDAAREAVLRAYVGERLARVLNLPPGREVPPDRSLRELGLDSLVSTELKNHLRTDLGVDVPMEKLLGEISSAGLVGLLLDRLSLARLLAAERPVSDDTFEEILL
jgi:acyl transferase domain-containing protein/SAM-dependent methyltransferase/acyl carrier protein